MTTDLWMLVWSAVLCVAIPLVGVVGVLAQPGGAAWGFGNRDTDFPLPPWVGRARRAHANLVENLAPFAALVLVAHVAGKANATTALGAQLFFAGRVAHAAVYVAGVPYVRSLVFGVSVAGALMILWEIVR